MVNEFCVKENEQQVGTFCVVEQFILVVKVTEEKDQILFSASY